MATIILLLADAGEAADNASSLEVRGRREAQNFEVAAVATCCCAVENIRGAPTIG